MEGGALSGAGVDFEVLGDYEALSARAAAVVEEEASRKPDLVMVAASGASPLGAYGALARSARLLSRMRLVKLDEWGGLAMDDPASCEAFVRRHLVGPLAISEARYLGFASDAPDPAAECARVSERLEAWGAADLAVLGLGRNGHLGFIEPAAGLPPRAHVARLSETSLAHPMLAAARGPVRDGMTLGMADVLACRRVLLLVSGAHKREALARLRRPEITTRFPASFLWLHPRVTYLCDRAAA